MAAACLDADCSLSPTSIDVSRRRPFNGTFRSPPSLYGSGIDLACYETFYDDEDDILKSNLLGYPEDSSHHLVVVALESDAATEALTSDVHEVPSFEDTVFFADNEARSYLNWSLLNADEGQVLRSSTTTEYNPASAYGISDLFHFFDEVHGADDVTMGVKVSENPDASRFRQCDFPILPDVFAEQEVPELISEPSKSAIKKKCCSNADNVCEDPDSRGHKQVAEQSCDVTCHVSDTESETLVLDETKSADTGNSQGGNESDLIASGSISDSNQSSEGISSDAESPVARRVIQSCLAPELTIQWQFIEE